MDHWIDLPAGFADLSQAQAWSKSVEQAKRRIELLRLVELVFRVEAIFKTRSDVHRLILGRSRERVGLELGAWISGPEGFSGPGAFEGLMELDACLWALKLAQQDPLTRLGPLGPDPSMARRRSLEALRHEMKAIEQLIEDDPRALDEAQALTGSCQWVTVERSHSSWRDICKALGAASAERAIERAQIERETQSGRSRQEPRVL